MTLIMTDDSEEGYLQLVILATLVDQFYLFWHGLYNDSIVMCDPSDIEKAIDAVERFDIQLPDDVVQAAEQISFEPLARLDQETASVRFVTFTKWGGFVEVWYVISREYPHHVLDGGNRILVEYDCGVFAQIDHPPGVLNSDPENDVLANAVFLPTWFGSMYIHHTTDFSVTFHLPTGVQPVEVHWVEPPLGWPGEPIVGVDEQGRVTGTWNNPDGNGYSRYLNGVSFPKPTFLGRLSGFPTRNH
jgi:hypothetical protein